MDSKYHMDSKCAIWRKLSMPSLTLRVSWVRFEECFKVLFIVKLASARFMGINIVALSQGSQLGTANARAIGAGISWPELP